MAALTFTRDQVWLQGTGDAGELWSPVISGIPSGAVINSVKLSFANGKYYNAPGKSAVYWGTDANGTQLWMVNGTTEGTDVTIDLTAYITGNGTYNLYFYKTANTGQTQSNVYFTGVTITVDYTIPFSACGAPTSVKVTLTITHGETTLSWSGATPGTSNAITGYEVQRCESSDGSSWGSWAALSTVSGTSLAVSPPATHGNYYKYRVRTQGAAGSAYYSGWKESDNTLRRDHAPLAGFTDPTLTVGESAIKALHMTELHDRVNSLRAFYGLAAYPFSAIIAGETSMAGWKAHVEEIRAAVDAIGKSHETWITIAENRPSVSVIKQLRDVVLAI